MAESAIPDVLAPDLAAVFCGINPGRGLGGRRRALREPAQRLLAPAPRRAPDPAPARAGGAVRAAGARVRRHQRGVPDDAGLGRPAARRLRRLGRAPGGHRPRARAAGGSRSSARRRTAGRSASGPTSGCRSGDSSTRCSSSSRRRRRRTPPSRTRSGCTGSRALRRLLGPGDRRGVRALVLDADDRVLLLGLHDAGRARSGPSPAARSSPARTRTALRRELAEETGLRGAIGPCIWRREHRFVWQRVLHQRERVYLVPVEGHEPAPELGPRRRGRLRTSAGGRSRSSSEPPSDFVPRRLPALLRELLERGPPTQPVDVV